MKISTSQIDGALSDTRSGSVGAPAQIGANSSSAAYAAPSSGDEVSLSGISQLLQNGAADRAGKIASLSNSVRAGGYDASASAVSRGLVSEMLARSSGY